MTNSPRPRRRPGPGLRFLATSPVLLLLALAGGAPAPGGATPLLAQAAGPVPSVETLLAAPFPYGIQASPTGAAVAWIQNDRGARNLWVAEAPAWEGRALTAWEDDDGQELAIAAWMPDGRTLLFVRGGGPNRQGENPNPRSDPQGVEQALWRISLEGGAPVRVTQAASATPSPDGSGFAFTRGGQIWWAPLPDAAPPGGSTAPAPEPRVLARIRGAPGSLRWSPDGSRLAFASNRGTHAFVGVLDVAEGTITWMDPGVDRDRDPVWSPDGTRLAFVRIAASTVPTSFRALRETHPWSIRVAEVATGSSIEIWRAREGTGSRFHGVNAASQLLWAADDHLVFPWEGTGWVLLYAVPAAGGPGGGAAEARVLTPGAFEVADAALTPDGRHVVYSSNQDDIDRRHLWRVAVAGGAPELLTPGDGIEWEPAPLADGGVAFLRSGARTPAHAAILPAPGTGPGAGAGAAPGDPGVARSLVPRGAPGGIPAGFPESRLVIPEAVMVTASDGMEVPAQLFLPPDLRPGERRPAIAFFHGGSRRQMLLGFHDRVYYHHSYALNQHLALQGYVVLSVNFRSGTGYGMEFREALDYGAGGASEFRDVVGAGLWLKARPEVDGDRIGLWGGSYGGYLTAMGLSRASDLFAAGVDVHGVHDWNVGIATFNPDYTPLNDPEAGRIAFESSPMATLDGWRSPVLLIHGDDDRNVRFLETVNLVEQLRVRGVHHELLVFPDEVHSFLLHRNWVRAYEATADFFGRTLGLRDR
jgi:dipeptidyl aminopeptidase/acylaminoacyl peptidase